MSNWLDDFLSYGAGGECPPKFVFWAGVTAIGAVLRRKVFIDQETFQWTPNFYTLLVGPPGVKKTTSINLAFNLLKHVPEMDFGPQSITWQQLITHMAEAKKTYKLNGEDFKASCVAIKLGEFGTFFDPLNRELVDNLTSIWDSELDVIKKETRTMGSDEIVNPYLTILAGTTPDWIGDNFSAKLVGSGFASRPLYAYAEKPPKRVAYVNRQKLSDRRQMRDSLIKRLNEYAEYSGEFRMTEEAYLWGEAWYERFRDAQERMPPMEQRFCERQQAHLHKLAMVMCVARGGWPTITPEDLIAADNKLKELADDAKIIFGKVGRTRLSMVAGNIVDTVRKTGPIAKSALFRCFFFRTMSIDDFEVAFNSAVKAKLVELSGPMSDVLISIKESE